VTDASDALHGAQGQSAGLIDSIKPAADVVREIVAEAEEILRSRVPTSL
jgi:NAD(P)H-dependent flavin oxidoreductase YrpB (nitropropane dioxygenase family)